MPIIVSIKEDPGRYIGYSFLVKLEEGDYVKGESIEESKTNENDEEDEDIGNQDSSYLYHTYKKKMTYSFEYYNSDYKLNDKTLRRFNFIIDGVRDCCEEFGTLECQSDLDYSELKHMISIHNKNLHSKTKNINLDRFEYGKDNKYIDPNNNIKSLVGLRILTIQSINSKNFLQNFLKFCKEDEGDAEIIEFTCCDINDSTKVKKVKFIMYNIHNSYYSHEYESVYYSNNEFRRTTGDL